jgi:prepilin-type N-terminal cleavage/methylation domain-containing protein
VRNSAFTLVEIIIVVAIIALLASIAIVNILQSRVIANNSLAKTTLRTLSTAAETFAVVNGGLYPDSEAALTGVTPPYLNRAYCGQKVSGFNFNCTWGTEGYLLTAEPASFGISGTATYSVTTGGIVTP